MNLYAISLEIRNALSLTTEDGELLPGAEEAWDRIELQFPDAAAYQRQLYLEQKADLEILKAKISGVREYLKELLREEADMMDRLDRRKAWVFRHMQKMGLQRLDGYRICKSPPSVVCTIANPDDIPDAFQRVTIELDKQFCLKHWEAGNDLPAGISVDANRTHLRIT